MSMDRDAAWRQLEGRARIRDRPRWLRGLSLAPAYVRYRITPWSNRPRRVLLTTFWGGSFEGVLPEHVTSVIARYSFFDQNLCRSMLRFVRPGDSVIDVGSHFGFFTLLASWLAGPTGHVLAVDAIESTYEQLARNVATNAAHPNVTLVHVALGDKEGELKFKDLGLEFSSLNTAFEIRGPLAKRAALHIKPVIVPMRPLDSVCREAGIETFDFIKIDAESSEHLVLKGFRDLLSRNSPLISIEMSDETGEETAHSRKVIDIMADMDFVPHVMEGRRLRAVAASESIGYRNFVFARPGDPRLHPEPSP